MAYEYLAGLDNIVQNGAASAVFFTTEHFGKFPGEYSTSRSTKRSVLRRRVWIGMCTGFIDMPYRDENGKWQLDEDERIIAEIAKRDPYRWLRHSDSPDPELLRRAGAWWKQ